MESITYKLIGLSNERFFIKLHSKILETEIMEFFFLLWAINETRVGENDSTMHCEIFLLS